MPSLTWQNIQAWSSIHTPYFIETGTQAGDTVSNVHQHFEKVWTIELSSPMAAKARQKFQDITHISVIEGDSSVVLRSLCTKLDQPTFFWLDGHQSGGFTAKGSKDCPLVEECQAIYDFCKVEAIVAIDDARMFGTRVDQDWSLITANVIEKIFADRVVNIRYFESVCALNDRMVIHLKPKQQLEINKWT